MNLGEIRPFLHHRKRPPQFMKLIRMFIQYLPQVVWLFSLIGNTRLCVMTPHWMKRHLILLPGYR